MREFFGIGKAIARRRSLKGPRGRQLGPRRFKAHAVALASLALLVGAPSAAAEEPTFGGTAIVAADTKPTCLNVLRTPCNMVWAFWTAGVALPGAYHQLPDLSFEPMLVDNVEVASSRKTPFTLTYHVKPAAVWSDGTPVSADDFIFTLDVILDPNNEIADRAGYDRIEEAVALDEKTVRFVFDEPYAAWKQLFSVVLPKHVLQGTDFDQVWNSEIADPETHEPIGAGPFLVTNFGESLTLSRNERWWGPHAPFLDEIVFRFISDPNAQAQALIDGEVDLIYPGLRLAQLEGRAGIAIESNLAPIFEHLDFNLASPTMPLLREQWFRKAVVLALDRGALLAQLFGDTGPDPELQSLVYGSAQPEYEPNFAHYVYRPGAVAEIMQDHGCTMGDDSIWSCGGVRASIKLATTKNNARRELAQQRMQEQASAAGIELVEDNSPAGVLFGPRLHEMDYELMMFAWVGSGDPAGWKHVYGCDGLSNFKAYCSKQVTDLLSASDAELDPPKRSFLVNKADKILAHDLPSFPLYSRPTFLAYRTTLHGPKDNPGPFDGPTWNVEDWWIE